MCRAVTRVCLGVEILGLPRVADEGLDFLGGHGHREVLVWVGLELGGTLLVDAFRVKHLLHSNPPGQEVEGGLLEVGLSVFLPVLGEKIDWEASSLVPLVSMKVAIAEVSRRTLLVHLAEVRIQSIEHLLRLLLVVEPWHDGADALSHALSGANHVHAVDRKTICGSKAQRVENADDENRGEDDNADNQHAHPSLVCDGDTREPECGLSGRGCGRRSLWCGDRWRTVRRRVVGRTGWR
mmetsp:Transcript_27985/g.85414  ORF Transcript_27985/g.85414 Transcript_27985/m.85414 type:complete len:238 (+) Transcript_27985:1604-2317(+)